jgi:predicted 3-demethylubiquinone-9 3-methyltransferase (glyoxalase superfamily)
MANQLYPCLWYDGQAKEAAIFYCSIFPNSKIISENPMAVVFELNNKKFMGLNGGPLYKFSPATSFVIECETQNEIDYYWEKLGEGGIFTVSAVGLTTNLVFPGKSFQQFWEN